MDRSQKQSEYFDSEALANMRAALDEAWRSVPLDQQTPGTRSGLAKAILHYATRGERDSTQLSLYAFIAVIEAPNGELRF